MRQRVESSQPILLLPCGQAQSQNCFVGEGHRGALVTCPCQPNRPHSPSLLPIYLSFVQPGRHISTATLPRGRRAKSDGANVREAVAAASPWMGESVLVVVAATVCHLYAWGQMFGEEGPPSWLWSCLQPPFHMAFVYQPLQSLFA